MTNYLFALCLVSNSVDSGSDLLLITEVAVGNWAEVLIEFVNKWNSCWDVESNDLILRHVVKILDEGTEGVAVSSDDDLLARLDGWDDLVEPEWKNTLDCCLEGLMKWKASWVEILVAWIVAWVVWRILLKWWWWDSESTAPFCDFLDTVLLSCISLVEALESTVVALVKTP